MKVVFLSNYYNHHQSAFSQAMLRKTEGNYAFIATGKMGEERKKLGYQNEKPPFVLYAYEAGEKEQCLRLLEEADAVIYGGGLAYDMSLVSDRIHKGKLTFLYSERWYKEGYAWWRWPVSIFKQYIKIGRFHNLYALCAGAFVAYDYSHTGLFFRRCYKWGYFPAFKQYEDFDALMAKKKPNRIVWVARMIDWKHPEMPVLLAKRLKEAGCDFHLDMIGGGDLRDSVARCIAEAGVEDCVSLLGTMPPEQVRAHMEEAGIFIFTSDRNEGWGAVLNEAMNSGCACVVNHAIGAAPYLTHDFENALVYRDTDTDGFCEKVTYLLKHQTEQRRLGKAAYETLKDEWNADAAADRFLQLAEALEHGNRHPDIFKTGPCSRAEKISDRWY